MHKFVIKKTNELYKGWLPDMIVAILIAIASLFVTTTYDVLGFVTHFGQSLALILYYVIVSILSYPTTYLFVLIWSLLFHINKKVISIERDSELYLDNPIVYLKIGNQEDIDIRDCYATIKRLEYKWINNEIDKERYGKDYRWIDQLVFRNLKRNNLSWSAFNPKEEKIIRANCEQRINIAKIENNKLVFIFENENSNNYTKSGEYYLEAVFGGYLEEKQIEQVEFHGLLRYVIEDDKHLLYLHPKKFDELKTRME